MLLQPRTCPALSHLVTDISRQFEVRDGHFVQYIYRNDLLIGYYTDGNIYIAKNIYKINKMIRTNSSIMRWAYFDRYNISNPQLVEILRQRLDKSWLYWFITEVRSCGWLP